MNLFATLNHGLHLAGVIFWIGGLAFQVLIMAPFLKADRPPCDYLVALSHRFSKCVGPILLILIVTGSLNIGFRRGGADLPQGYISMLGFKVLLVAAAASLHLFEIMRAPYHKDDSSSSVWPRRSHQWTFILGLVIIFMAAMLRHWRASL